MSAKIYRFPARGRFAAIEPPASQSDVNFSAARVAKAIFGNAWYHEEALQADRNEKNEKDK